MIMKLFHNLLKDEAKEATKILVGRKNELKELLSKKAYMPVADETNAILTKKGVVRQQYHMNSTGTRSSTLHARKGDHRGSRGSMEDLGCQEGALACRHHRKD